MKTCVLFVSIIIYTFSSLAFACESLQVKADRYATLKRGGGSAKQMNRWSAQKRDYTERYRECRRARPKVHYASGAKKNNKRKIKTDYQQRRSLTSHDPVTQKLLTTCNFWIDSYNQTPNRDNKNYRDTACRALDDAIKQKTDLAVHTPFERSLKDCIKPDNHVDDEVKECMRGERQAEWQ